ncbi:hypothetical protein ACFE04_025826 [Oxalis oulophora]
MGQEDSELTIIQEWPLCLPTRSQTPSPLQPESLQIIVDGATSVSFNNNNVVVVETNTIDDWLPITESRNGSFWSATCHLLNSGIGYQALILPVAFATLGWAWGSVCLCIAFFWQLYTTWLLVQLHETSSVPGIRYSRYLQLAIAAFGPKMGKLLVIFPVMYLSGGSCVVLIINGGGVLKQLYQLLSGSDLSGTLWFLVFACVAILMAQLLPNLNSVAKVSLIGAVAGILYCTLVWTLSIRKGRVENVSYNHPEEMDKSAMDRFSSVLNSLGIIVIAFKGHNVVLEIQGTLPSSSKHPSKKPMWTSVLVSYMIVAMCLFPVAIVGFWGYGNKVSQNGGLLKAFWEFHKRETSNLLMAAVYIIIIINLLSSYQIYAMPVFDTLESIYVVRKKRRCSRCVRAGIRICFGGLTFLVAVAFPFLGQLAILVGGLTLNLTFTYPCFIWNIVEKGRKYGKMWWMNLGLGCLGIALSVLLVGAALWNLVKNGIDANFFKP